MIFNLINTKAENDVLDSDEDYGVIVVKDDIPQVFIPLDESSIDDWSTFIRVDPNNIEEIKKTTSVYFGMVDPDMVFLVKKKLF